MIKNMESGTKLMYNKRLKVTETDCYKTMSEILVVLNYLF